MSIPGWTDDDMRALYDEIASTLGEGDEFVEVGVAYGQSLVYLADREWPRGKPKLWAVDLWAEFMGGDNLPPEVFAQLTQYRSPRAAFAAMVHEHLPASRGMALQMMQMASVEAAQSFGTESLAGVFIDARHTYGECRNDIAAWHPKVRAGGWFAGHDYSNVFPGVVQAVNEAFGLEIERKNAVWIARRP
jgi:Methyltransferase domain